jgi:HPt (histidine-containing phosphotransfer) domain-containing protein
MTVDQQTAPSVMEGEVLDWEGLKTRCMGNVDLIGRVLTKFTTELDADLAALESAVAASNCSAVASVAHRIKGMSGSVKADSIHRLAAVAEEDALRGEADLLPERLRQLRNDQRRVAELLTRVSSGHN